MEHLHYIFPPHAECWRYDTWMIAIHAIGDFFTMLAYFAIPSILWCVARRYRMKILSSILYFFAAFILLCGVTHLMGLLLIWRGGTMYWVAGVAKLLTAVVSVTAAIVTYLKMPSVFSAMKQAQMLRQVIHRRKEELQKPRSERTITDEEMVEHFAQLEELADKVLSMGAQVA